MQDLDYRNSMLERIKQGVPHLVVRNYGRNDVREELIKYHPETNCFTYHMGRNEFYLNNNDEIKPYHVFFDVQFTYKKERGEEFYKAFAVVKCSQYPTLNVSYYRSGTNLEEIKLWLIKGIEQDINNNPASLGMKMSYDIKYKKYRGCVVPSGMTATNFIKSIATKWVKVVL